MTWTTALRNGLRHEASVFTSYIRRAPEPPDLEVIPGDLIGRVVNSGQSWESWLTPYLTDHCRPDAVALDVGANIGAHTRTLAAASRQVIAFEPQVRVFEVLRRNTSALDNVTLVNAAASDHDGILAVHHARGNSGAATVSHGSGDEATPSVRLDDMDLPGPIALIKIDVEGHERKVIQGGRQTILRDRPVIVLEDTSRTRFFLRSLGYRCDRISFFDYLCTPVP